MIALLSPAKSLDYESPLLTSRSTKPRFIPESAQLIKILRRLSAKDLSSLMSISDKLAELNHERNLSWEEELTKENSRSAILAFTGDVYQGIDLPNWSADDFSQAQKQIRILSGLYGLLRPLDLIQPYRLEMGTRLKTEAGTNLYQFWGDQLTHCLNKDLKKSGSTVVVNLASKEYFSAINEKELEGELISPVFKDEKNGTYKIISFHAKKARGMMADFIVQNKLSKPSELEKFMTAGYRFSKTDSTPESPVFLR